MVDVVVDAHSSISSTRTVSISSNPGRPLPPRPYVGPTQAASSPTIVSSTQTLIDVDTVQGLIVANDMLALERGSAEASPNMTVDALLSKYFTWGAAYNLCRILALPLGLAAFDDSSIDVRFQFESALESLWDLPWSVNRTYRNATCNLTGSIGVSVGILTVVPQVNRTYFPPTFTVFVVGHGPAAAVLVSFLSHTLPEGYTPAYVPFDLKETIGLVALTYDSPGPPEETNVTVYAVTKDSPVSDDGGVAIWTFLVVQVLSLSSAVVIGMTAVRWLLKPPTLPPLKAQIMMGFDDVVVNVPLSKHERAETSINEVATQMEFD